MPFLIFFGGLFAVRLCAKIMEEWGSKIRALISTILACLIGLWVVKIDVNEFESAFNAILVVPILLGVGTSLMAVTLGWATDNGVWVESFRTSNYSYGHTSGSMSLTAMIFLATVAGSFIFFFIWAFTWYVAYIIYFVFHGILLLVGIFKGE